MWRGLGSQRGCGGWWACACDERPTSPLPPRCPAADPERGQGSNSVRVCVLHSTAYCQNTAQRLSYLSSVLPTAALVTALTCTQTTTRCPMSLPTPCSPAVRLGNPRQSAHQATPENLRLLFDLVSCATHRPPPMSTKHLTPAAVRCIFFLLPRSAESTCHTGTQSATLHPLPHILYNVTNLLPGLGA